VATVYRRVKNWQAEVQNSPSVFLPTAFYCDTFSVNGHELALALPC